MGPIPEDLIPFLIFGLFVLIQIVRAQRRRKARRSAAGGVLAPPTQPLEQPLTDAEPAAEAPMAPVLMPTVAEGPRPKPPERLPQAPAAARSNVKHSVRRRLLDDRHALQEAIVVATVLGPCLAQRPRDAGPGRDTRAGRKPV